MFSAGHETTSTTLRWAIAYLVHNPGCQTEIQNQLDEEVGRDRMPGLDDRPSLPLVQATIWKHFASEMSLKQLFLITL